MSTCGICTCTYLSIHVHYIPTKYLLETTTSNICVTILNEMYSKNYDIYILSFLSFNFRNKLLLCGYSQGFWHRGSNFPLSKLILCPTSRLLSSRCPVPQKNNIHDRFQRTSRNYNTPVSILTLCSTTTITPPIM